MPVKFWRSGGRLVLPLLLSLYLFGSLLGCSASPRIEGVVVRVERVISGQTLEVRPIESASSKAMRVRLIGVQVPPGEQKNWSQQAKERLAEWVNGQELLLEEDLQPQDQYSQTLAYLWLDGQLLNERLVAEGYALAMARSPNLKYHRRFTRAQERARLSGVGIWDPDRPLLMP